MSKYLLFPSLLRYLRSRSQFWRYVAFFRAACHPPLAVERDRSTDVQGGEDASAVSDLTNATDKMSKNSKHTTCTNGSIGTRQSRVDAAVSKEEEKWNKKLLLEKEAKAKAEKLAAEVDQDKNQLIARLMKELAGIKADKPIVGGNSNPQIDKEPLQDGVLHTPQPKQTTSAPSSILHERSSLAKSAGSRGSGNKQTWNSQLHALSADELKTAAEELRLTQDVGNQVPNPREMDISTHASPLSLKIPPLPDPEDLHFDDTRGEFPLAECSFCKIANTRRRCDTVMADNSENFHMYGEARCARAFCIDCINKYSGDVSPQIASSTCPFHILQGRAADSIAGQGPSTKPLADDSIQSQNPLDHNTRQPGPGSDRAGAP